MERTAVRRPQPEGRRGWGSADVDQVDRYHSTVLASPSANEVRARNPNSFSALVTSTQRLGWPSGFEVSHTVSPVNPVRVAMRPTRSRIEISNPAPRLTGSL